MTAGFRGDVGVVPRQFLRQLVDVLVFHAFRRRTGSGRLWLRATGSTVFSQLVDTFVILSGDSDFSPLVSKLRENDKVVIGVGVKNSTSELLTANCDEFIFYDDLVRESAKPKRARRKPAAKKAARKSRAKTEDDKQQEALDLVVETVEALFKERGEEEKVWGSMVKQTLKRRKPGFDETYHGFRTFGQLLEEAQARGLLTLQMDEKSGGYIIKELIRED